MTLAVRLGALLAFVAALVPASAAAERGADVSTNWAGYAVTGPGTPVAFTSVTGTWTQPKVACRARSERAAVAIWVGLGGYQTESTLLQQIGSSVECSPAGKAVYAAWYELVPAPPVKLKLAVRPGDTITATVSVNAAGTNVRLVLRNRTSGAAVTRSELVGAAPYSAEWIVETPSSCDRVRCFSLPLAKFGRVGFTHVSASSAGRAGTLAGPWQTVSIQLDPGAGQAFLPGGPRPDKGTPGAAAARAGAPSAAGDSFQVTWRSGAGDAKSALIA